jgi:hypothetical protein
MILPDSRDRLDVHAVTNELLRPCADEDFTGACRLLESRGDVYGVSGNEGLTCARSDVARVDADADFEAESSDGLLHLGRSTHRAERVVLVHLGNAEDGHDRVTDELLHHASVALQDLAQRGVVARHQFPQHFRIAALAERGRPHEVAEENRDRLAGPGRQLNGESGPAVSAEAETVRALLATGRAEHHKTRV